MQSNDYRGLNSPENYHPDVKKYAMCLAFHTFSAMTFEVWTSLPQVDSRLSQTNSMEWRESEMQGGISGTKHAELDNPERNRPEKQEKLGKSEGKANRV
jgi:hypothetical protein